MHKERILDLGIGSGGEYINKNSARRVGIDLEKWKLQDLRTNYDSVLPVLSEAQRLPFKNNSFTGIETILPFGSLLSNGLQNPLINCQKFDEENDYPQGWYPEFHRVLVPHGELTIYGDLWVVPEVIKDTSSDHFIEEESGPLSVEEFRNLGTITSDILTVSNIGKYSRIIDRNWEAGLVKIRLRSNKVHE
jgi:hypothetical protein